MNSFDEILTKAKSLRKKKIVIVAAEDLHVLEAIKIATEIGFVIPIFSGKIDQVIDLSKKINFDISQFEKFDITDSEASSIFAVNFIREKKADILMKGKVTTLTLLRAVVDKYHGLTKGNLLSHFAIHQLPSYHKLLAITDAAMNIKPNLEEKVEILKNALEVLLKLGYDNPKIAVLCPVESVNPKIESTVHASQLTNMNRNNQITGCIIDGPLALDNAISKEAALLKGIKGEVAGDADLLLTPDLDSGNILYKAINFLAGGISAGIITGANSPIVLSSRSDSKLSKLYSIALAACL